MADTEIVDVWLHGDKESAAILASELSQRLGYPEYSCEWEQLYRAVFFNELRVRVEIDLETLSSRIVSADRGDP